jgi:hypothetical protein
MPSCTVRRTCRNCKRGRWPSGLTAPAALWRGGGLVPLPAVMKQMEDFIERTLRERRTVQQALEDILAKYNRTPSGNERTMLARMIEVLKDEIALRNSPRGDRDHVAA